MSASPLLLTQRIRGFCVAGVYLCLILLPALGFAEAHQSRILPSSKQIALPQLSDGLGWKQPMYYSTIQTADIDGDGQSEVLARWIDGLTVYRFENGTLLRHSRIPALSDDADFYQPSWYSTIQTAVLNPKLRQADVIAREHDGIHVFRYEPRNISGASSACMRLSGRSPIRIRAGPTGRSRNTVRRSTCRFN